MLKGLRTAVYGVNVPEVQCLFEDQWDCILYHPGAGFIEIRWSIIWKQIQKAGSSGNHVNNS